MSIELILTITIPALAGFFIFIIKHLYSRVADLDRRVRDSIGEQEVRRLIDDKINPIRDDIHDIKLKLDKLVDMYLTSKIRG